MTAGVPPAGGKVAGRFDVAVIGGGPAGSAAAMALAEKGARVALFEKERLPRYKTCGGGITRRALDLLPGGAAAVVERTCRRVRLDLCPGRLSFNLLREKPFLGMVMRDRFDMAMIEAARGAGVRIHEGCRVTGLRPRQGGVTVETGHGEVLCRFVVAADGAMGRTAAMAGWRRRCLLAPAMEAELEPGPGTLGAADGIARFDFGAAPGGYAWIFPKRDILSVGLGVFHRDGAFLLPERLKAYLVRCGLGECRTIRWRGGAIPVSPRPGGFVKGRVLLAGDAAGLADPLTGEGIYGALQSGRLAAEALIQGGFQEEAVRRLYESGLRKALLRDLAVARGLSRFFYGWPRIRNALFSFRGQGLAEAVGLVVMGARGYGELLSDGRNYLRLLGLGRRSPR